MAIDTGHTACEYPWIHLLHFIVAPASKHSLCIFVHAATERTRFVCLTAGHVIPSCLVVARYSESLDPYV